MDAQTETTSYDKKIGFLLTVANAEEKRRKAVEQKASFVITSNSIVLSAIIALGLPLVSGSSSSSRIQISLTLFALAAILLSIYYAYRALMYPMEQERWGILDLGSAPKKEYNIFLFLKIAEYSKKDYQQEIEKLTDQTILEQLSAQVHNLARILRYRYLRLRRAYWSFIVALCAFSVFAVARLLNL